MSAAGPVDFVVEPAELHRFGAVLLSTIAMIDATHASRAGQPVALAYGIAALTPITLDIHKLALACFQSAGNYQSCENLLTPSFIKKFEEIEPALARGIAAGLFAVDKLVGGGESPVTATAVATASVAVAASIPALLGRLQRSSASQEILIETSSGVSGRQFTMYLPGTEYWLPLNSKKAFDLGSDLAAFAKPGVSAPERAAVQALAAKGFGTRLGDSLTLVGYSEGGIIGANLISSGAITHLGGRVGGLVAVASPVSAAQLPEGTRVISIEHTDDPVPALDLAEHNSDSTWTTVKLAPAGLQTHELSSYQQSLSDLPAQQLAKLNEALAGITGGRHYGSAEITGFEAVRTRG